MNRQKELSYFKRENKPPLQLLRISSVIILIVLFSAVIVGCRKAGYRLVQDNLPSNADAMVILMGNFPERVLHAFDLYNEDLSDRIVIVEESMGPYRSLEERGVRVETNSEQAVRALITMGVSTDHITLLSGDARSTLNEAVIIGNYLAGKPDIDTIILVSSPAHMRRASMIFKAVLRDSQTPMFIGCSPSAYSSFNPEGWWRRKEDAQAVLSEFVKIGSFVMFERRGMRRAEKTN